MSLDNLLGISLEPIESDPLAIRRLMEAATRNIKDSQITAVSNEL